MGARDWRQLRLFVQSVWHNPVQFEVKLLLTMGCCCTTKICQLRVCFCQYRYIKFSNIGSSSPYVRPATVCNYLLTLYFRSAGGVVELHFSNSRPSVGVRMLTLTCCLWILLPSGHAIHELHKTDVSYPCVSGGILTDNSWRKAARTYVSFSWPLHFDSCSYA